MLCSSREETAMKEAIQAIQAWEAHFLSLHQRIARHFARSEPRRRVSAYLKGLTSPCERKNGWQLAEMAQESCPDGMQRLLNQAHWDADAVRDELRQYAVEQLGDKAAVLVIDETGFLKQGRKSVGVQRQYSGTAGRIENCQVGVFLAYASHRGSALVDRALYLPQEWCNDQQRRQEAGVPEAVRFATKPELARQMLERALEAGVPAAWVTGDAVYGGDRKLRVWLEAQGQPFVLAVSVKETLWMPGWQQMRADKATAGLKPEDWQQMSAGPGAKGERVYDWAWQRLGRLQITAEDQRWGHWLLVRRSIEAPEQLDYYVVFGPAHTTLAEVVGVAGARWNIETCFKTVKSEFGLDQYEVRRFDAWHRFITLVLLAHAFVSAMRAMEAERIDGEKGAQKLASCA
jgi:SRSO17 transposase